MTGDEPCRPPPMWALCRLDDNGNEFEMGRYADEAAAERARREFERRGHKQLYFVRRLQPSPIQPRIIL